MMTSRFQNSLKDQYEEYVEYVKLSLLYEDTDIDTFSTWSELHYGTPRLTCSEWEYAYA